MQCNQLSQAHHLCACTTDDTNRAPNNQKSSKGQGAMCAKKRGGQSKEQDGFSLGMVFTGDGG